MATTELPATTLPEQVNRNIRAEIARAGTDRELVLAAIGKSDDSLRRRLDGRQEWSLSEIDKVAAVIGVSRSKLLEDD